MSVSLCVLDSNSDVVSVALSRDGSTLYGAATTIKVWTRAKGAIRKQFSLSSRFDSHSITLAS